MTIRPILKLSRQFRNPFSKAALVNWIVFKPEATEISWFPKLVVLV